MSSPLTELRNDNMDKSEDTGMDSVSMSPKGTEREKCFYELSFYNYIPELLKRKELYDSRFHH